MQTKQQKMHCIGPVEKSLQTLTVLVVVLSVMVWTSSQQGVHDLKSDLDQDKCPRPPPSPQNALISAGSLLKLHRGKIGVYDKIEFECKNGYQESGLMWTLCGTKGKWYPDKKSPKAGVCKKVKMRRDPPSCQLNEFRCLKGDIVCIEDTRRCDCTFDCEDASDEIGCKNPRQTISADPYSHSKSGVLSSPGYPWYPKHGFNCTYSFETRANYRVQLAFEEFDLQQKSNGDCIDYIKLSGVDSEDLNEVDKRAQDLSTIKCQNRFSNFYTIASNTSVSLVMKVQMTKLRLLGSSDDNKFSGYSLSWTVKYKSKILQERENRTRENVNHIDKWRSGQKVQKEGLFTVLIPIAISALLPLSVIAFLCCQRASNNSKSAENLNDGAESQESDLTQSDPPGKRFERMDNYRRSSHCNCTRESSKLLRGSTPGGNTNKNSAKKGQCSQQLQTCYPHDTYFVRQDNTEILSLFHERNSDTTSFHASLPACRRDSDTTSFHASLPARRRDSDTTSFHASLPMRRRDSDTTSFHSLVPAYTVLEGGHGWCFNPADAHQYLSGRICDGREQIHCLKCSSVAEHEQNLKTEHICDSRQQSTNYCCESKYQYPCREYATVDPAGRPACAYGKNSQKIISPYDCILEMEQRGYRTYKQPFYEPLTVNELINDGNKDLNYIKLCKYDHQTSRNDFENTHISRV